MQILKQQFQTKVRSGYRLWQIGGRKPAAAQCTPAVPRARPAAARGFSRKRMIGALSNEAPAHQRLGGSLALAVKAMDAGVQLLRVHDVPETVQAVRVWRGLKDAALTDFSQLAP